MKTLASDIRFAEPSDAASLADIHAAAWRSAYTGIIPFRSLGGMIRRRGVDWWQAALERQAAILVIEFAGRPIGYATLGRNRTRAIEASGEIYEIYLLPEYQGLGFGRRLFGAARELLRERGLKGLVVWALAENEQAGAFYAAMGGVDIAEGSETFEARTIRKVAFRWN
ncbi:GNAT family N-acetyltransferase [Aureimonas leprariae]|uniref:GNAT family N-acetyltransferase n=1 Tax=Plantimonas leprariae TaxID=2615207 RepID=A0A7V7PRC1_9HYPH|nr:GNAT family N-acetyltransferase [Aureimonas leprariae]KAB0681237.1 GNAT family N-acetyltransferase [Aureimonas leprariae]